jgi:hypothetical protein
VKSRLNCDEFYNDGAEASQATLLRASCYLIEGKQLMRALVVYSQPILQNNWNLSNRKYPRSAHMEQLLSRIPSLISHS